ncbi:MAG: endolytic transglycosylase MltG [Pseudomonadota bacterium]
MKSRALLFFSILNIFFILSSYAANASKAPASLLPLITVEVPPYSNSAEIARRLVNAGVLTHPWKFLLGISLSHKKAFAPGTYTFKSGMDIIDIIDVLKKAPVYKVTIPEGLTVAEIVRYLNEQSFLTGGIFLLPSEGMLLPETYVVRYGDKREVVLKRIELSMKTTVKTLWESSAASKARTAEMGIKSELELLTLASIVEKETGIAAERAHIAGVFLNRLAQKMRLQSDPTVSYAVTNGKQPLGRQLRKRDLAEQSPMNTYTTSGLPPQPIACPGKAALLAVLAPDTTKDLYFVANGVGGHRFSETLDGHNKNVTHWRRAQRSADDE